MANSDLLNEGFLRDWEDPDKCAHEIVKFAAKVSGLPDPYRKRG